MRTLELKIENYTISVPVFEKDGRHWVALRPICEALGVAVNKQQKRVMESEMITWDLMVSRDSIGRTQEMLCVDIDHIGEWIFGINPNKVKPEIKERMILFRRKLQAVLYAAVTGHIDTNMVQTLLAEISVLRDTISTLEKTVDYLIKKDSLNEKYVDKQLASVGGKLLSNMSQKRRRGPTVA